jgi:hypothetical protein
VEALAMLPLLAAGIGGKAWGTGLVSKGGKHMNPSLYLIVLLIGIIMGLMAGAS